MTPRPPGEDIWLSGSTGDAALGLAHLEGRVALDAEAAAHCIARLEAPEPRVALGLRLRGLAAAAIDVSDGLLADLGHIAAQSKLAAEIDYDALPRSAALRTCPDRRVADDAVLAGGDDYELLFTAAAPQRTAVEDAGRAARIAVTRIGRMVAGAPGVRVLSGGKLVDATRRGFDHFGGA